MIEGIDKAQELSTWIKSASPNCRRTRWDRARRRRRKSSIEDLADKHTPRLSYGRTGSGTWAAGYTRVFVGLGIRVSTAVGETYPGSFVFLETEDRDER
jgi:hypothetical protein